MTRIYRPKPSCPRDLGYFYCEACLARHEQEQSDLDFPIPIQACGRTLGNKACGRTHLGYEQCASCKAQKRTEPHLHIGEFECVAIVQGDIEVETEQCCL